MTFVGFFGRVFLRIHVFTAIWENMVLEPFPTTVYKQIQTVYNQLSGDQNLGYLPHIVDYTTQLYGCYKLYGVFNKPL